MMRNGSLAALLFALGSLVSAPGAEAQETTGNWSGLIWKSPPQPAPPITFTAVSAKWTQPSVWCPKPYSRVSIWVGLDNGTVEQAGTWAVCGSAFPTRHNPHPAPLYYKAFWEMYGSGGGQQPFTVSPGDTIEASVGYANGSYVLEVKDLTNGQSFSTTQACSVCKRSTAEWIVERPGKGSTYPLANYGSVEFSNISTSPGENVITSENVVRSYINMVQRNTTLSTCGPAPSPLPQPAAVTLTLAFNCFWQAASGP